MEVADAGFAVIPHYDGAYAGEIVDAMVALFTIFTVVFLLVTPKRNKHIRRLLWCTSVLYLLRSFTISMTVFPNPYKQCEWTMNIKDIDLVDTYSYTWLFVMDFLDILLMKTKTCGDVMYSGHTALVTSMAMCWIISCKKLAVRLVIISISIVILLSVISTRFHYTDDVLIGSVITILVYYAYSSFETSKIRCAMYSFVRANLAERLRSDPMLERRPLFSDIAFRFIDGPAGEYPDEVFSIHTANKMFSLGA